MIGFIKWLISQYQVYKLEKTFKQDNSYDDQVFMKNFVNCIELGFTERQLFALMNLFSSMEK